MNLGLRAILLIAAIVLFVIGLFADENWTDLTSLGLAAFAASFVVGDLPLGGRRRR